MLINKRNFLLAVLGCLALSLGAQHTTSPYSRYGYGILKDQSVGASRSMGGISYGMRRSQNVNPGNPASYSRVDSLTFIFDMGVDYSNGKLSQGGNSQRDNNGGLSYLTMQLPLAKNVGMSFGLLPVTSVGYSFGEASTDGLTYSKQFNGSGGFSQAYLGLSYEFVKGLSIGANADFIFGSLKNDRIVPSLGSGSADVIYNYRKLTISTFKFDLGMQYQTPVSKNNVLTVGAVFTPAINATSKYTSTTLYGRNTTSGLSLTAADTVSLSGVNTGLPLTAGVGFTLSHKRNLLFGADVTFQRWEKVKYSSAMMDDMDSFDRFNNRWKFSGGLEYVIDPTDRSFAKRIRFRGGANYSNSYINVKDNAGNVAGYKEYGATFGIGLPIRDSYTGRTSFINLGFEYLYVKPELSTLIKEQYFGITLNVNINDLWFMKNKFK